MSNRTVEEIRSAVSEAYGARAREVIAGNAVSCCGGSAAAGIKEQYYTGADDLPETVVSYGCGNPIAIAGLRTGETVLDLGSGAGLDCFLAARQVGPTGLVIGLDMTDEMLALAEQNRAKVGADNVEFRKGIMEAMPAADDSVDVIISNCVINLSPDKDAVFREAFRVLRSGGRLHVSDVVLLHGLSPAEQEDLDLWAGCISGALQANDYAGRLHAAGFGDVSIRIQERVDDDGKPSSKPWRSALIDAHRAASGTTSRRSSTLQTIELITVPASQAGACFATDGDGATRCC